VDFLLAFVWLKPTAVVGQSIFFWSDLCLKMDLSGALDHYGATRRAQSDEKGGYLRKIDISLGSRGPGLEKDQGGMTEGGQWKISHL